MKIDIYMITDLTNNKLYIGQSVNVENRFKGHIYGRNNKKTPLIDRVIKKRGKDNFNFKTIATAYNQNDADELEKHYIKKYNTMKPNGYNILKGGRKQQGSWNSKPILVYNLNGEYENEYESASYYENFINNNYKTRSIRHCCNGDVERYKEKIFRYKEKFIEVNPYIKPKSSRVKKIIQLDLNGNIINTFSSITTASKTTKTNRTGIIGCLKGRYKTSNGFNWIYDGEEPKATNTYIRKIEIHCIDKNKNIVKKYVSCTEAQDDLKLKKGSYKNIWKNLNTNKLCYGYYWEKVNFVPSSNK